MVPLQVLQGLTCQKRKVRVEILVNVIGLRTINLRSGFIASFKIADLPKRKKRHVKGQIQISYDPVIHAKITSTIASKRVGKNSQPEKVHRSGQKLIIRYSSLGEAKNYITKGVEMRHYVSTGL